MNNIYTSYLINLQGITNFKQHAFNLYDQFYLNFTDNPSNFSNLLDREELKQLNRVLKVYFKAVCNQLGDFIEVNIQNKINSQSQIQNISFTVFIASLIMFFLFYWYPTVTRMNSEV